TVLSIILYSCFLYLLQFTNMNEVGLIPIKAGIAFVLSFLVKRSRIPLHLLAASIAVFIHLAIGTVADVGVILIHPSLSSLHIGFMRLRFDFHLHVLQIIVHIIILWGSTLLSRSLYRKLASIREEYQCILAGITLLAAMVTQALLHVIKTAPLGISETTTILSWILLMLCVIMLLVLFSIRTRWESEHYTKSLLLSMNHEISQGFNLLANKNDELRIQAHDFRSHLMTIHNMPEKERQEYIAELLKHQTGKTMIISTGNRFIDAVLYSKIPLIEQNQIRFSHNIRIPKTVCFSMTDLCTIVSNQMDNAIEACCKIDDPEKRWIRYTIDQTGDFYAFICENSIVENSVTESTLRTTSKPEDRYKHGFGIRSIDMCAERNQGSVSYEITSTEFLSRVILQNNLDTNDVNSDNP
ncbi:MAG: GHKL domain-containing protein, partial [Firmicutes bacterium]|nr:GHKL domain-containing protein [Bacillota bacterium]